ncbi:MAG: HDIG domain-containing protein [Prevotellaceae bacterium]|jgi:putative nucleotidyltransferase with HDIG domain|nr:HDIG domain-containing protein [Prevotellaceae bacterium]
MIDKDEIKKDPRLPLWLNGGLFVLAIALIVQLSPSEDMFKFYYRNGKPWQHEFLSAPFDFPIYKSEAALKKERDSVAKNTASYYFFNEKMQEEEIGKFNATIGADYDSVAAELPDLYKKYVVAALEYVYKKGIVAPAEMERLKEDKQQEISIIKNQVQTSQAKVGDLFTGKTAYEYIINHAPDFLDIQKLKSYDIDGYLRENLTYDRKKSEQAREEALKKVSLTAGMVQAGERIIDKGEIVSERTFQILNSLKHETESRVSVGEKHYLLLVGQILLAGTLMLMLFLYLYLFRPQTFAKFRHVLFIIIMMLIILTLAYLTLEYTKLSIYIVPFALVPIMVRTFFDSRTALFVHIIGVLLASFMVASPFEFVLLQITVGMATISSLKDMTQRSQLMQVAIIVAATYAVMFLSYTLITDGNVAKINWWTFLYFAVNGLLLLFAYGLIYIFEKTFGFLSNVTLVELSNVNSPLLMQFSETAPGTFQHSLQVASLATEAAAKTNANPLLVRTGALYHDIGKIVNPMDFIENQQGRVNPLAEMPEKEAVKIIINHVAEGVKIAQKHNLPKPLIDFIQTHHAKSKAKYFYNKYRNEHPNEDIDEAAFSYPGPKPFTREMAILMMADAIEAASRSLPEYTEEALETMVEKIIDAQIAEGSFKDVPITFQHIEKIKNIFKRKLVNIYHSRIKYPELNKK